MHADGLVIAHCAYDAWGPLMAGANATPYGYKGQWGYYTDSETGLLLLTYRYLDPTTGRFLTRDPIGCEGGINLYAYVGNGALSVFDPSGWTPRTCMMPLYLVPVPPKPRPEGKVTCSTAGYPMHVSRNDPRYPCALRVCRRYAQLWDEMERIAEDLCGGKSPWSVIICAETNSLYPPVDRGHPCWREGGGGLFCCVECQIRVCAWVSQPYEQRLNEWRDRELERCGF